MKRIIIAITTIILLLALCACNGGSAKSSNPDEMTAQDLPEVSAEQPYEGNSSLINYAGVRGDILDSDSDDLPYWNGLDFGPNLEYDEEFIIQGDPGEYLNAAEAAKLTFEAMRDNGFIPEHDKNTRYYTPTEDVQYTMTLVDLIDILGEECYVYRLIVDDPNGELGTAFAFAYQSGNIYQGYGSEWLKTEVSVEIFVFPFSHITVNFSLDDLEFIQEDEIYLLNGEVWVDSNWLPYGNDLSAMIEEYNKNANPFGGEISEWINLEHHDALSEQFSLPVWIAEYKCGYNEDTTLCLDAIILIDEHTHYILHTSRAADADFNSEIDYAARIMALFASITVDAW